MGMTDGDNNRIRRIGFFNMLFGAAVAVVVVVVASIHGQVGVAVFFGIVAVAAVIGAFISRARHPGS
jgi:uncharacterized membrane protein